MIEKLKQFVADVQLLKKAMHAILVNQKVIMTYMQYNVLITPDKTKSKWAALFDKSLIATSDMLKVMEDPDRWL